MSMIICMVVIFALGIAGVLASIETLHDIHKGLKEVEENTAKPNVNKRMEEFRRRMEDKTKRMQEKTRQLQEKTKQLKDKGRV